MCMYELSKLLIFIFNFVVWAAGAALLGVGIYLVCGDDIQEVVSIFGVDVYYAGAYILMICGACMLLVGFCGCCGAMKESTLLLKLYFILLLILFVAEFGIGIWALVVYDDIPSAIDTGMNEWIDELTGGHSDAASINSFNTIQKNMECCGGNTTVHKYNSPCEMWADVYPNTTADEDYVAAMSYCGCTAGTSNCAAVANCMTTDTLAVYTTSCNDAVVSFVEDNITIIAALGLAFGAAEVIGMLITCYLINEIGNK